MDKATCPICKSNGKPLYKNAIDTVFGADGKWDIFTCDKSTCGHLWVHPPLRPEEISLLYENYYTHGNKKRTLSQSALLRLYKTLRIFYVRNKYCYTKNINWLYLIFFKFLSFWRGLCVYFESSVFYLHNQKQRKLIEIGCGDGEYLQLMQELGWDVEGIDSDPMAVKTARTNGINVRCIGLDEVESLTDKYDVVVLRHVIEHLINPNAALIICRRLLKPDGKLVLITPNSRSFGHYLFNARWRGLEPPRHLNIFNMKNLCRITEDCGLDVISSFTTSNAAALIYKSSVESGLSKNKLAIRFLSLLLTPLYFILQEINAMMVSLNIDMGEELIVIAGNASAEVPDNL